MSILKEVLSELFGMFVGDAWLSIAILVVVAASAGLARGAGSPLLAGAVLLVGCVLVLLGAVARAARQR